MGTESSEANPLDGEGPVRMVTLDPFYIDTYPITNAVSEGLNSKIQWVKYTARGFRNFANFVTAIYFNRSSPCAFRHLCSARRT